MDNGGSINFVSVIKRLLCLKHLGGFYMHSCLFEKQKIKMLILSETIEFSNNRNGYLQERVKPLSLLEKDTKLHWNMCMILGAEILISSFRVNKLKMHFFCHWCKKIVICTKQRNDEVFPLLWEKLSVHLHLW